MKKQPIYVAFSTQKGGVGKSTFTVSVASLLHYTRGYNIGVIDCDPTQHSIDGLRKRDNEQVTNNDYYNNLAYEQFGMLNKKAYPIVCSDTQQAITVADTLVATDDMEFDIIFFDLPGTLNSPGVVESLAGLDYVFVPIIADQLVLESGLRFARMYNIIEKYTT